MSSDCKLHNLNRRRSAASIAVLVLLVIFPALAWAQGAPGVPVNPPAGQVAPAAAFPDITTNLLDMLRALGMFLYPFAITTLILVWLTVERLVVLRRGRVIPKPFVQRFLMLVENGEMGRDESLQTCEENGSSIAKVFAHGVRKWGKSSVEVEQAIIDGGERQIGEMRKNLRYINGIATLSPLIGLLGTVWGMLDSFSTIAKAGAMGRSEDLAHGIAMALVCTAAGLIITIPALVSYMYLVGRVDSLVMEMDDLSQRLVWSISSEGLAEKVTPPKRLKEPADAPQKKAV